MQTTIKRSLHSKILFLIIGLMTIGVVLSIAWELKNREQELLDEKLRASNFIAQPILNAIYTDMLEERADMARHLIKALGHVEGLEMKIIRSNGVEQAFKDYKTIEAVKKEFGEIRPEWITNHPDEPINIAKGVETTEFKEAFNSFKADWKRGPIFYVDRSEKIPTFTYLQPIEKKAKCNSCHTAEGARGSLMITTPLDEMYTILRGHRNQWIISGILAIVGGAALLSLLIRTSITGPIKRNVEVIKRIAEGGGAIRERVEKTSGDEIGYLTDAFNSMLDTLEKRDEENERLFHMVAKSKEEWVATFDAIQDLISIHDIDNRILKVNRALANKFNTTPEDLIGRDCHDLFFKGTESNKECPHKTTLATCKVADADYDDLTIEGSYNITTFPVLDDNGKPWATVHITRDITHEKLLGEQLLHAEKLSSVGKLVAGIAHELNNPLMGIMGFSQILMDMPGDKKIEDIKDKIGKIYHESLRTAKIVKNLLTFARASKTEREYHNINEIIKKTSEMREYSLRTNNIEITLNLESQLPHTMVDIYQLQQVFINIINNAEDAMVEVHAKGKIEVTTALKKNKIVITFKDDGPGVRKEVIRKVFDPFFTTKDVGKGTGLGLSITHGIITEHGGAIDIASPEGGGAVVTIELPVLKREAWAQVTKAITEDSPIADNSVSRYSDKQVLIVDDEKSIRETLADLLNKKGFTVQTARDGREALEALTEARFALMIFDIKMPGISGIELYNEIVKKHEYLKSHLIAVTGDVFSADVKEFLSTTKCPYFLKPFELKKMMSLINSIVDS
jgi:PAS domain S-box-containing protein